MSTNLPMSVLSLEAAPSVSERYVHINSHDVIELLSGEGYDVVKATTSAPTKRNPLYAKHRIDFQHRDAEPIVGGAVPRIIWINSHDGTSSARVQMGLYRYVCSNGLVIGDTVAQQSVKHAGENAKTMTQKVIEMAQYTSKVRTTVERWANIELTASQRNMYARLVTQLRWGDAQMYEPDEVLGVRRAEDDRGDLWSVFNRAQENTVRGGLVGLNRNGRQLTSRPITDIHRDLSFNGSLWELTNEFADVI